MIVLNLRCRNLHDFEGWFASSDAFADQHARGLVSCPSCGIADITRLPAAAHIGTGATSPAEPREASGEALAFHMGEALNALRRIVERTENVGIRFPEEARKIHYGESPKRDIRGKATPDQAKELEEEGIQVFPLPLVPDDETH